MDALDYRPHPSVRLPGNRASLMPKLHDHNDNPAATAQAAILGGVPEDCRQDAGRPDELPAYPCVPAMGH